MAFDVFGPFEIPRNKEKTLIEEEDFDTTRKEVEEKMEGLSDACGCYVFATKAAKGYTPWYVGQTKKTGLFKEALSPSKLNHYNKIINTVGGLPILFLLPLLTEGERFHKSSERLPEIDFLEKWLIGEALQKNENLINVQHAEFLKRFRVKGVLNARQGETTKLDATEFRRVIWRAHKPNGSSNDKQTRSEPSEVSGPYTTLEETTPSI